MRLRRTKTGFDNRDGQQRASLLTKAVVVALLVPALAGCVAAEEEDEITWSVEDYGVWGMDGESDDALDYPPEAMLIPARFTISPDQWPDEYVGTLDDGRKFFLHSSFLGDGFSTAVFLWNPDGTFESIDVSPLADPNKTAEVLAKRYIALGSPNIEPISVSPFSEKYEGDEFGFVGYKGGDLETQGPVAVVILMPANRVADYWPWDGEG